MTTGRNSDARTVEAFLSLFPDALVTLTWVTDGTTDAPTTLSARFAHGGGDSEIRGATVTRALHRVATAAARQQHARALRLVAEQTPQRRASLSAHVDQDRPTFSGLAFNRSIPDATFIPVRSYPDLDAAVKWLRDVLGCRERLRIPGHRVQLTLGTGAVVAVAWDASTAPATGGRPPATLMVRVRDVDGTYARALANGATGLTAPADHPYGERQASVRDPAGHAWTLTQTIDDVDPASWGGQLVT